MSFYYDPKGRGVVYTVLVLVGVFIMLLPDDEREAAMSFFKARRARFPDPLPPRPPKVPVPARVVDRAPTQANCRTHWKRIKDDGGTVHLIRGLEDDRLSFTYQTTRSNNTLLVTAYVEQFITLLPEDQRPAAVKFFRSKKAKFNEERALSLDGLTPTMNHS